MGIFLIFMQKIHIFTKNRVFTSTGAGKKFLKGGASPKARGLPKKEGAGHLTGTMMCSLDRFGDSLKCRFNAKIEYKFLAICRIVRRYGVV